MAHLRGIPTVLPVAGAALVLLTACGGSNSSAKTSTPTSVQTSSATSAPVPSTTAVAGPTTPPRTSTPASTASRTPTTASSTAAKSSAAAGSAGLAAVVLRPSDLPAGWKASAYQSDPADDAQHATLLKCVGVRNTDADRVGEAHSPDFSAGNAGISADATRYKSAADLSADTATLRNPKAIACYKKLTTPSFLGLPAGATVDAKSFQLTNRENGQPANVVGNLHAQIVVTVSSQHVRLFIDSAFIRGSRIEAEVDYENITQRVPLSLQKTLTARVAARAAKA